MKPVLPEWARAISIFVLTFALMVILAGLAGLKIEWVDGAMPPEMYNRPD